MITTLRHGLLGALCIAGLALGGCTVNTGKASPGNGTSGSTNPGSSNPGGTSGSTAARKQACNDVMTCVVACTQGDTACESACIDAGSPTAQTKFKALNDCLNASTCQDAACLQTECASQITACTEDVPPEDPNGRHATPTGSLSQQDLVGAWENIDVAAGWATSFTFNADGSYRKMFVFVDPNPCTFFKKRTIVDDGRVQVDGDTLTVVPSATLQTMIGCTDNESGVKTISMDTTYKFELAGSTLTLTDTISNKVTVFTKK